MASALFDKGRENILKGSIAWVSGDIRAIFYDTADGAVTISTDDALDDIVGAGRVATSSASLANKTATNGVADADDLTISSVSGDQFEAIILYLHTGVESTSLLVCYIDSYTGLPCTPNGGNITVQWPSDSNKIFKL